MTLYTVDHPTDVRIVQTLGLVYGNSVRAVSTSADIVAKLKNAVGGEIEEYTKLMAEAREQSLDRMAAHAKARGANAIVGVRFASSEIATGAAELLAYGTAVVVADGATADARG